MTPTDTLRQDRFGNIIYNVKDGRQPKHKICFKDEVGEGKIAEINHVASYKKYNKQGVDGTKTFCTCEIF